MVERDVERRSGGGRRRQRGRVGRRRREIGRPREAFEAQPVRLGGHGTAEGEGSAAREGGQPGRTESLCVHVDPRKRVARQPGHRVLVGRRVGERPLLEVGLEPVELRLRLRDRRPPVHVRLHVLLAGAIEQAGELGLVAGLYESDGAGVLLIRRSERDDVELRSDRGGQVVDVHRTGSFQERLVQQLAPGGEAHEQADRPPELRRGGIGVDREEHGRIGRGERRSRPRLPGRAAATGHER